MNEKEQIFAKLNQNLHAIGRAMSIATVILLVAVPLVIGTLSGGKLDVKGFLTGFLNVGILYIPMALVEFLVYPPMLGVGGSYISFITGNVTNMKIPCAINARDIAKTGVGTPENEIISTLSTATSAMSAATRTRSPLLSRRTNAENTKNAEEHCFAMLLFS